MTRGQVTIELREDHTCLVSISKAYIFLFSINKSYAILLNITQDHAYKHIYIIREIYTYLMVEVVTVNVYYDSSCNNIFDVFKV